LSFEEAMKYVPPENSCGIRILNSHWESFNPDLPEHKNWIKINTYKFDDVWPKEWKEYSWVDINSEEFEKYYNIQKEAYPKMTKESLINLLESQGHFSERKMIFTEKDAIKILDDFDKVKESVQNIMIHCVYGRNRSPGIGIAMNDIYGWGIKGLEEKFPNYRRYFYDTMIKAAKKK